jgi:hypothetical protein
VVAGRFESQLKVTSVRISLTRWAAFRYVIESADREGHWTVWADQRANKNISAEIGEAPPERTVSRMVRIVFSPMQDDTPVREIFDQIVELAANKGLASGTALYTDSTHLKANVNKNNFDVARIAVKPAAYLAALDAAIERLDRERERFNFDIRAVGVDAGYAAAAITQRLEERNIYGVIGYCTPAHRDGYFYKRDYKYDEKLDVYICPNGQLLPYRTTNRAKASASTTPIPSSAKGVRCTSSEPNRAMQPRW